VFLTEGLLTIAACWPKQTVASHLKSTEETQIC
jgi:hypothetical protein